jgi:hypothetical protein
MIHPEPMGPWHAGEWGFFLLANAIIVYFCAPGLLVDVRRWIAGNRAGPSAP